ncbi:hypothetical protein [Streptomyces sp. NPDC013187]|uniref:hypothetical protein n=1 Tax=Streptomyces sp. NPDC013187 TaxID=3364865 RepID=UPI003692242C
MIPRSVIEGPARISYEPFTNDHESVASSQISKGRGGSPTVASVFRDFPTLLGETTA